MSNNQKMSAKDKEGFQEFPQANFTIPLPVQMEEVSAMAQSLLEGQQDVGESVEGDPYARAVRYLEEHRIIEILQVTMVTVYAGNWSSPITITL